MPRQTRPGELGDPWPLPTPAFLRQEYGAAVQQCVESCQRGSMPAMMFAAINQIPVRRSAWRGRRHRRRVFEAPQTLVIPLALKAEGHDAGAQPTSKIQTSRLGRNQLGRYGATGVTETRRRPPSRHLHLQHQALSCCSAVQYSAGSWTTCSRRSGLAPESNHARQKVASKVDSKCDRTHGLLVIAPLMQTDCWLMQSRMKRTP